MDWRDLPSLSALRAFACVAESLSFSEAGRVLNVTHAAVSQQVRGLEAHLGVSLVERAGRGLALTAEGQQLAVGLGEGFGRIAGAVAEVARNASERPLHVTLTPAFAMSWLMPRISDFKQRHPDIELMLNPTPQLVDLQHGDVDLAIRFGEGPWPGLQSESLILTDYVVVGATSLVGEEGDVAPEALQDFPWLQELGTNELARWLERQGVVPRARLNITHLPGYMVLDGVRRGAGITATARIFVEELIRAGSLRVLASDLRPPESGYHLVRRPGVPRPPLAAFIRWVQEKAAETTERCGRR
ncbi:LysR family transcriptional regulator [Roseibium aestuarii]|uniref:LysR family transcriptional regulator n=1 Tax=Roseibium aestuarii TaxID=2600299 RepID=A0ABW4JVJ9_9HYPH|nr:LysR family transcriptional regulator [Roseibium aestuarii]